MSCSTGEWRRGITEVLFSSLIPAIFIYVHIFYKTSHRLKFLH